MEQKKTDLINDYSPTMDQDGQAILGSSGGKEPIENRPSPIDEVTELKPSKSFKNSAPTLRSGFDSEIDRAREASWQAGLIQAKHNHRRPQVIAVGWLRRKIRFLLGDEPIGVDPWQRDVVSNVIHYARQHPAHVFSAGVGVGLYVGNRKSSRFTKPE